MKKKTIPFLFAFIVFLFVVQASSAVYYSLDFNNPSPQNSLIIDPVRTNAVLLQLTTNRDATCRYNLASSPYQSMPFTFDQNFGTIHKKTLTDLSDGLYRYFIKCMDASGNESSELKAEFTVSLPVTAQVTFSKTPPLTAGRIEVKLTTSKLLSQTPLLSYSFDSISYNPIPLTGSGNTWNGYLIISDSAEESVGSFKFQGRDLEGVQGTEITSGGIFIVDNLAPETITDIKSEGFDGRIELDWSLEEDVTTFKIYRSTSGGVSKSDYYKSTSSESFTDTSVERGKTYYYRVSSIDEAGNEGAFSPEVYATALLQNTTITQTGLEPRYHGFVDSFTVEINTLLEKIEMSRNDFDSSSEKEKKIYSGLKLSRELDSAKSELNSLKSEVENYKQQSLSKSDLDTRINSARLKMNSIKKRIPESFTDIQEKTIKKEITEEKIRKLILEISPTTEEGMLEKMSEKTIKKIEQSEFRVESSFYTLEIIYSDGTRKEKSLVIQEIAGDLSDYENYTLYESISPEVAESSSELDIKNNDYELAKENLILSFSSDTKEISYSLNKKIDISSAEKILTTILVKEEPEVESPKITGFFSFIESSPSSGTLGLVIIALLVFGLIVYYTFFFQSSIKVLEKIAPLRKKIDSAEEALLNGDSQKALAYYNSMTQDYKALGKKEKSEIISEISSLHKKLSGGENEK